MSFGSKIVVSAVAVFAVALTALLIPHFRTPSTAVAGPTVTGSIARTNPVVETTRIVPADVMGGGHMFSLTGDGSN